MKSIKVMVLYMWAFNASINAVKISKEFKKDWFGFKCMRNSDRSSVQSLFLKVSFIGLPKILFGKRGMEALVEIQNKKWKFKAIRWAIERNYNTLVLNITCSHSPDIDWLLVVISTFQLNDWYFSKSYFPSYEELGGRGTKVKVFKDIDYDEFLKIWLFIFYKNIPKKFL